MKKNYPINMNIPGAHLPMDRQLRERGYKNETKTEIPQYNCFSEHDLIHR